MIKLSREEKKILRSVEKGEWKPIKNVKEEIKKYQAYARATFQKDQRINIRISKKDLESVQERALEEGLPYQTLIASILHKYVSGRLMESTR